MYIYLHQAEDNLFVSPCEKDNPVQDQTPSSSQIVIEENKTESLVSDLDIGHAFGVHLDPNKRYLFLKNTWEPSKNYILPTKTKNKHNRKFQMGWLSKYKWLACIQQVKGWRIL